MTAASASCPHQRQDHVSTGEKKMVTKSVREGGQGGEVAPEDWQALPADPRGTHTSVRRKPDRAKSCGVERGDFRGTADGGSGPGSFLST